MLSLPGGSSNDQPTSTPPRAALVKESSRTGPGSMSGMTPSSPLRPRWACRNGRPGSTPCSMPTPTPTSPAAAIPAPPSRKVRRVGTPASLPVDEPGGTSARRGRPVVMSRKTLLVPLLVAAVTAVCEARRPPLVEPVEISAAEAPASPPPVEVLRSWDAQRAVPGRAATQGDWRPSTRRARWRAATTVAMLRAWVGTRAGRPRAAHPAARPSTSWHARGRPGRCRSPTGSWVVSRSGPACADRSRATVPPPAPCDCGSSAARGGSPPCAPEEVTPQAD